MGYGVKYWSEGKAFEALVNEEADAIEHSGATVTAAARRQLVEIASPHLDEMTLWLGQAGSSAERQLREAIRDQLLDAVATGVADADDVLASIKRRCRIVFFCWNLARFRDLLRPERDNAG